VERLNIERENSSMAKDKLFLFHNKSQFLFYIGTLSKVVLHCPNMVYLGYLRKNMTVYLLVFGMLSRTMLLRDRLKTTQY
jgi:hypothetical protein